MAELPELPKEEIDRRFPGGFTARDEANAIVAYAFRNGPIEDLHAGKSSKILKDPSYSRITQDEMKELVIFACEHVEMLLSLKETDPKKYRTMVIGYNIAFCTGWDR